MDHLDKCFLKSYDSRAGADFQEGFFRETRNKDSSITEKGELEVLNVQTSEQEA